MEKEGASTNASNETNAQNDAQMPDVIQKAFLQRSLSSGPRTNASGAGSQVAGSQNKYKLVFMGDQNVGKTSLIARFAYNRFETSYQPTVGIDFVSKTVYVETKGIRLQLWDTAGQERFHSLIPSYIRDSNVAVVVYDITNRQSFQNITRWVETVRNFRGQDSCIFIVGNKVDSAESRIVSTDEGENLAHQLEAQWLEASAKSDLNVSQLFKRIATHLVSQDQTTVPEDVERKEVQATTVKLDAPAPPDQEGSCLC